MSESGQQQTGGGWQVGGGLEPLAPSPLENGLQVPQVACIGFVGFIAFTSFPVY